MVLVLLWQLLLVLRRWFEFSIINATCPIAACSRTRNIFGLEGWVQRQWYCAQVFLSLGKSRDVLDQFCFLRSARDNLLQLESQQGLWGISYFWKVRDDFLIVYWGGQMHAYTFREGQEEGTVWEKCVMLNEKKSLDRKSVQQCASPQ